MGINFAHERKKFFEEQRKLCKEYEAAGMRREQMLEMFEFDLHQFNRDIAFYRHTQQMSVEKDEDFEEEGRSALLLKYMERLSVTQQPSEDEKFWWIDEIDDQKLLAGLLKLSEEELNLIDQLAFCELTQKEIGVMQGKSQAAISQRIKTLRKKLKSSS